jgi:hypothetical protein
VFFFFGGRFLPFGNKNNKSILTNRKDFCEKVVQKLPDLEEFLV